jgi:hypothetical protein
MRKMNSVVHFEMPYDERERMAKFYQDAFGWQTRMLGEEMGNYVLVRRWAPPQAPANWFRPSLARASRLPEMSRQKVRFRSIVISRATFAVARSCSAICITKHRDRTGRLFLKADHAVLTSHSAKSKRPNSGIQAASGCHLPYFSNAPPLQAN